MRSLAASLALLVILPAAARGACTLTIVGNDAVFEGCNVHIRDGSNSTDGAVTGLGNLIVGYNANTVPALPASARGGSHNIVVGDRHTYSSFGGIVAGDHNAISAPHASVVGGEDNTASGEYAAVTGGFQNVAYGEWASVSGGFGSNASNEYAWIGGGAYNVASGRYSCVVGGGWNQATGDHSSVAGGGLTVASGIYSTVSGGIFRLADGSYEQCGGVCTP